MIYDLEQKDFQWMFVSYKYRSFWYVNLYNICNHIFNNLQNNWQQYRLDLHVDLYQFIIIIMIFFRDD